MTVVIPYRFTGDDTELRYTIKSINKHMKGVDQIVVVTDQHPHYIPGKRKQRDIVNRIYAACMDSTVSDPFICMSDDVYLLEDMEAATIPYWHRGMFNHGKLSSTYAALATNSIKVGARFNFDNHAPIRYYKQKFIDRVYTPHLLGEYLIQSLYCINEPGEFMEDVKLKGFRSYDEIKQAITGAKRFSTAGSAMNKDILKVLTELYDT